MSTETTKDVSAELAGKIGTVVLFTLAACGWLWYQAPPAPQTVKVVSVNYQRGEYSATTKDPRLGWIRLTARCGQFGDVCPALGKHDAGETANLTQPQNIISQAEER